MIVNGGDDGDVSRLPSPPFGICVMVGFGWWGCAKLWYNVRHEAVAQLQDQPVLLPDAACEVGLHRGCRRREESLSARQAVQDSAHFTPSLWSGTPSESASSIARAQFLKAVGAIC